MGKTWSILAPDYEILVKTGDTKGGGTDANVYITLIDQNGIRSREIHLDVKWRNDFERGNIDVFKCRKLPILGRITKIEIWRDSKGLRDDWFLEWVKVKACKPCSQAQVSPRDLNHSVDNAESKILDVSNKENVRLSENIPKEETEEEKTPDEVDKLKATVEDSNETLLEDAKTTAGTTDEANKPKLSDEKSTEKAESSNDQCKRTKEENDYIVFPCNRWIKANRKYVLAQYDSCLPQFDEQQAQRVTELAEKKKKYQFQEKVPGLPRQAKSFPAEESFSNDYKWDLVRRKASLLARSKVTKFTSGSTWRKIEDFKSIYNGPFQLPPTYRYWKSDEHFGRQRLQGANPTMLKLCKEIPANLGVWQNMITSFLEGKTVKEAIEGKEIYIVDFKELDGIECKDGRTLCAPIALFHAKPDGRLMPLCIQLFQEDGEENPVFLPNDPEYTWTLAKMYFNNADAALHQSCAHLGFTHLLCESVAVSVHRTLSPSHPIFRLLMPHFLFLIAINVLAVQRLVCPSGWIDETMTMGRKGMFEIIKRRFEAWRFGVEGWLPSALEANGVDDAEALPYYPYRDDGLLVHKAIHTYVTEMVNIIYDDPEKLADDNEIQAWASCLTDAQNGCGFKEVPGNGAFANNEQLAQTITTVIYIGSVGHAAANFNQYDEYGFPPNYPAILKGTPPKTKDEISEIDIVKRLPSKEITLSIMVITKLLSDRGTNSLGNFEMEYLFFPEALAVIDRFRKDLNNVSKIIQERDKKRALPYPYLDPKDIPNAISI